jgi:hypothetical protein
MQRVLNHIDVLDASDGDRAMLAKNQAMLDHQVASYDRVSKRGELENRNQNGNPKDTDSDPEAEKPAASRRETGQQDREQIATGERQALKYQRQRVKRSRSKPLSNVGFGYA